MMNVLPPTRIALAAIISFATPALAWGMRCGSTLVGPGESQHQILSKCGAPARRDPDVQYLLVGGIRLQRESIWYYDFGHERFINVLHFRDGILSRITDAGYGFGDTPSQGCDPNQIAIGMTDYELLRTCGAPQDRRDSTLALVPADKAPAGTYVVIHMQYWTYDFGPNQFERIVTIRKGVVEQIRYSDQL